MLKTIKTNLHYFLIIILATVVTFWGIQSTFYQQDEWNGLGLSMARGVNSIFIDNFSFVDLALGNGRVLSNFIQYIVLSKFPFQNAPFIFLAILFHIICSCILFLLIKRILKNSLIAMIGTLFFLVNSVSQGTVTWSVVAIGAIGSSIFVLLSVFCFFRYTDTAKRKWLTWTFLLVYVSLWFKETGLYLLLLFPIASLLYKKHHFVKLFRSYWFFFVTFGLIVLYRILLLRLRTTTSNLYITGHNENFFLTLLFRILLYPLTAFSQIFFPGDMLLTLSRNVMKSVYPFLSTATNSSSIAQSVVLDLVSLMLTFLFFGIVFLFLRKESYTIKKSIYFWTLFTLFSFIPYVVLLRDFSYLDSRYYYLSVAGGAVLFSWVLDKLRTVFGNRKFYFIVVPLACLFLLSHVTVVKEKLQEQILFSRWRTSYIRQQKDLVSTLSTKKNIFLITGDKNFWADGNVIPFQQGTGYTLMALYYSTGQIPTALLSKNFLFDIGSQGYAEDGQYGFGYFRDESEMKKAIGSYPNSQIKIYRLQYDGEKKMLTK